jgi:hypothetical protein
MDQTAPLIFTVLSRGASRPRRFRTVRPGINSNDANGKLTSNPCAPHRWRVFPATDRIMDGGTAPTVTGDVRVNVVDCGRSLNGVKGARTTTASKGLPASVLHR